MSDDGTLHHMRRHEFKQVVLCNDNASGLRAIIAIHSTVLGPAMGGLRMRPYATEQDAMRDALRLALGMTYKNAAAGLNFGGGKAVIIGDPATEKSEPLLRTMGRMIDGLGGQYITGFDIGTTLDDMETIASETEHVVTLPEHAGGSGDVSAATALGVLQAMRACAERAWGTPELHGRSVALQGLGAVGGKVLAELVRDGASVVVADVDPQRVARAVESPGVAAVAPDAIYDADVDIFCPCAVGGIVNDATIPRLKARAIAGGANNVLAEARHGDELERRGIVYAVDFVANSGGIVYDTDRLRPGGLRPERATAAVRRIFDRVKELFVIAEHDGISCQRAAERLAEARIDAARRRR